MCHIILVVLGLISARTVTGAAAVGMGCPPTQNQPLLIIAATVTVPD